LWLFSALTVPVGGLCPPGKVQYCIDGHNPPYDLISGVGKFGSGHRTI